MFFVVQQSHGGGEGSVSLGPIQSSERTIEVSGSVSASTAQNNAGATQTEPLPAFVRRCTCITIIQTCPLPRISPPQLLNRTELLHTIESKES